MNKSYLVVQRANLLLEAQKNIGIRTVAQRITNGENAFVNDVIDQFGFSKDEARHILKVFAKLKLVKIDAVGGQYQLKNGRFWDKFVMKNALKEKV